MAFISSIASRIFGLAVGLVLLMILLVGFLLWQVTALNRDLQSISGYLAPLDRVLSKLNEAGLRRRLAFERLESAMHATTDRSAAMDEASKNYETFTNLVEEHILTARELLAQPPAGAEARPELARVRTLLDQVDAGYDIVTTRQREILDLLGKGEVVRAMHILRVLDDIQRLLQTQRSDLQDTTASMLGAVTAEASHRHTEVVWTTVIATITSVLLGLAIAALTTNRLVEPVRSLMRGLAIVEGGDLSIELPVRSTDEIGRLTRSFNFFVNELRRKEVMRRTFGKYIDPRLLERVLNEPGAADATGGRQEMTVSFADLVGFTRLGEQLTPAGVVNLLNRHFTLQAEAIQAHHGVVDKFMGDAVMAFWGEPFIGTENGAALGCRAALAQAHAIEELQRRLPEITGLRKHLPQVGLRIGMSTGEIVVGNIGSENTRSYTVIGDRVNLAARLESANRFYGTKILICDVTRNEAGEAIVAREIDTILVQGKAESTTAFALLGLAGTVSDEDLSLCRYSSEALAAYRSRNWNDAEAGFRACLALRPHDQPARLFLERIQRLRDNPPPSDWNSAWGLDSK